MLYNVLLLKFYPSRRGKAFVCFETKKILDSLRRSGFTGFLVIHVRAWLATRQLSSILSEKELKDYIKSLKEIRVFTADLQNKLFLFHRVIIEETPRLIKFKEEKLTEEHVKLLQISMPPPSKLPCPHGQVL